MDLLYSGGAPLVSLFGDWVSLRLLRLGTVISLTIVSARCPPFSALFFSSMGELAFLSRLTRNRKSSDHIVGHLGKGKSSRRHQELAHDGAVRGTSL